MQVERSRATQPYVDRDGLPARRPRRHRLTFALLGALVTLALLAAAAGLHPQTARAASSAPFSLQQAELNAADGAPGDILGCSVAVSGDTALVGAPNHAVGGTAYVFVYSGGVWTQQAELIASDGAAGDYFGSSVSISGDSALVGASGHAVGGNAYQGAAYVFVRSGSTWTQRAELTAADGAAWDNLGSSVAISGDTALVGAPSHAVSGNSQQGAAYVFAGSGSDLDPAGRADRQ